MAKATSDIRSLARQHTAGAIAALIGVMESPEASPPARVSAAIAILDRGWGKPGQPDDANPDLLDGVSTDELRDLLDTVRAMRGAAPQGAERGDAGEVDAENPASD